MVCGIDRFRGEGDGQPILEDAHSKLIPPVSPPLSAFVTTWSGLFGVSVRFVPILGISIGVGFLVWFLVLGLVRHGYGHSHHSFSSSAVYARLLVLVILVNALVICFRLRILTIGVLLWTR